MPVFDDQGINVIAVLSFDSDEDILDVLREVQPELEKYSPFIYRALIG